MDRRAGGGRWRFPGAVLGLAGCCVVQSAAAATIAVDTLLDDVEGGCSLRAAIVSANLDSSPDGSSCASGSGRDRITFSVDGLLALNEPLPGLLGDVELVGPGSAALVIDGGGAGSVLVVSGPEVSISGLGLTGGNAAFGGGLWIAAGASATVAGLDVFSNTAAQGGGGVAVAGALVMSDSVVRDNVAAGGGEVFGGGGIFLSASGSLTLTDAGISDNSTDGRGGGLFLGASAEPAVLRGITVQGNAAVTGGGIYAAAALFVDDATVAENTARGGPELVGGGLHAEASVVLSAVMVAGNEAGGGTGAGGVLSAGGDVSMTGGRVEGNRLVSGDAAADAAGGIMGALVSLAGVTVTDNSAETADASGSTGAGVFARSGVTIADSTISNNVSAGPSARISGAAFVAGVVPSVLLNSTISGNRAGAGAGINLAAAGATLSVINSTITGNHGDGVDYAGIRADGAVSLGNTIVFSNDVDCVAGPGGSFVSNGHNIDGDGSCSLGAGGDLPREDPLLGPLADNGGPTMTHALLSRSPAVDAGDNDLCPDADQRGVGRPDDGNLDGAAVCDIGAVEQLSDDLRIDGLAIDDEEITVGEQFGFNAAAGNGGRRDIDAVVLRVDLPPELAYVSGSAACSAVGGEVICDIGRLGPGRSTEVQILLRALGGGTVAVRATVSGEAIDHNTGNDAAELMVTIANANPNPGGGDGGAGGDDSGNDTDTDTGGGGEAIIVVDTGGGALSPAVLALLCAGMAAARRRRRKMARAG
jgi:MYXO-CTERM domain-containing protein